MGSALSGVHRVKPPNARKQKQQRCMHPHSELRSRCHAARCATELADDAHNDYVRLPIALLESPPVHTKGMTHPTTTPPPLPLSSARCVGTARTREVADGGKPPAGGESACSTAARPAGAGCRPRRSPRTGGGAKYQTAAVVLAGQGSRGGQSVGSGGGGGPPHPNVTPPEGWVEDSAMRGVAPAKLSRVRVPPPLSRAHGWRSRRTTTTARGPQRTRKPGPRNGPALAAGHPPTSRVRRRQDG